MEWVLLLADVVLISLLVRLWSNYQTLANDLKRRRQAALQRTDEHHQRTEMLRKEAETVKVQIPEIETLAATLKGDLARAEERLARLELRGRD